MGDKKKKPMLIDCIHFKPEKTCTHSKVPKSGFLMTRRICRVATGQKPGCVFRTRFDTKCKNGESTD
jgi:hypothetical protein